MQKLLNKIILLLFFPFLIGSSCYEDCNDPVPYHPLDQDFLSYCVFPKGSWWLYEEENSGEIDSTYITFMQYTRNEDILGRGCNVKYEYEAVDVRQVFRGEELYATAFPQVKDANSVWYYEYRIGISPYFFKFPNNIRDTLDDGPGGTYIMNRYDSLTVSGKFYKDVIKILHTPSQIEFYSKGVGVIRREFNDSTKWNLIKYHIKD